MADFEAVPRLNGAALPVLTPGSETEQLWTTASVAPLVGATVIVQRSPIPQGTKAREIRARRIREYWRAVLSARPIPQDIDQEALLDNLCLSPATNSRYPHTHVWWRRNEGSDSVGKSRQWFLKIADWVGGRASLTKDDMERCPVPLPSRLDMWTLFVMGGSVGKVVVHYAFSQLTRGWIEKGRLQFLVQELGLPLSEASHITFWTQPREEDEDDREN